MGQGNFSELSQEPMFLSHESFLVPGYYKIDGDLSYIMADAGACVPAAPLKPQDRPWYTRGFVMEGKKKTAEGLTAYIRLLMSVVCLSLFDGIRRTGASMGFD